MSAPSLSSVLLSALERVLGSCALISLGILVASNWNAIELNSGVVEFAPRRMEKAAWIVIAFYFAILAVDLVRRGHGNPINLVNAVCAGMIALATLFSIPEMLIVAPEGLQEVYWLRRNKRILWNEIVEINTGKKTKLVTFIAANGTKILYRGGQADHPLLLSMVKRYCGDNLPPDFPREPS